MNIRIVHGNCVAGMAKLPDASVDCVVTDPPYAEVDRAYGRWTVPEWWALMIDGVIPQIRRVLKPRGSAVFVIQPNSERIGKMRGWVFDFMSWCCREWNMVQDAWWWNTATLPSCVSIHGGLMRPSLKACVWCGPEDCHRDQGSALWSESMASQAKRMSAQMLRSDRQARPSSHSVNEHAAYSAAMVRGGVTPFNVMPVPNTVAAGASGMAGHGAGTPELVCRWWVRYLCPVGGIVLDPFTGAGTVPVACVKEGCDFVGFEKEAAYVQAARARVKKAMAELERPG